uniref:RING-CH-type domain-containing protein n=1 Tax=Kalanchoe fedtschenkoi TaxID=63787 RepID=A0A7N0UIH3_KALFE
MHHNEDYKRSGDPPLDLENGGSPHDTRQLLSSINCELSEEAQVVSNEGTNAGSGLIFSKAVPEDVSSGNPHSSSSVMPTASVASDRQTHDHSVFSSAPNHTSVPQCGSANNQKMLVHPTIVAPGGTHSFDFNAVRSNNEESSIVLSPKKPHLSRNSSSHKQCRVCQQEKDEDLISLGCQCRGELAKTHRSCIDTWFRTKGSNRCEICQHVAVNVPPPESGSSVCFQYLLLLVLQII